VAEEIKRTYGTCLVSDLPKRAVIRLAEFIPDSTETYSRRELGEIIGARLQDLFELLQKELRKINRVRLLPAGVVLVGGSSMIPGMVDLTRTEIGLPAEQGMPIQFEPAPDDQQGPPLATALGVVRWARSKSPHAASSQWGEYVSHMTSRPWLKWLKSFLP
ncbi:MAG: cell division FtsA domain-containing protein, partial [Candidatus Sungbacteria bacterium]|nr:cell division FtsA domain-containing protein [Candidatus Sungbacteria bacterium]